MVEIDYKNDLFLLFCSLLFYISFLVLNLTHDTDARENLNATIYDANPQELCNNVYENRIFRDETGHETLRCVKLEIPNNIIYTRSCEELHLKSDEVFEEC